MSKNTSRKSPECPFGFGFSFNALVTSGVTAYQRRLHLQHLLPVSQVVIDDYSYQNSQWIISRLATALRQERNRGRNSHWAYNLNRHIALLQAYRGERKFLETLEN